MSKITVLHVSEAFGWSGGAAQCLFLAQELRKMGHENLIASPLGGDLFKKAAAAGFETYDFSPSGKTDFAAAWELKNIYRSRFVDVVHAHHPKAHNMCLLAKLFSSRRPVLVVSRRVSHKLPENFLAKMKYKTALVNAYLPVCDYVKKMLIDYGIDDRRLFTVYSGVDKSRYFKKEKDFAFKRSLNLKENDFLISLIGNFSSDKGQKIFIEALALLKKKGFSFSALFAGKNTESDELKKMFYNLLAGEKAVFLGLRDDVERLLNITDINVNAAIKGEALSGSLREAMACGVPSVASAIAGNGEILKDGYNGFLFNTGDPVSLAEKLQILMEDESLMKKFSANSVLAIDEKFTVPKMAQETLKIYLSLLK
ncbi:MAG: hypothetical protein Fur0012_06620 [Elusimicrobiota bacterium]